MGSYNQKFWLMSIFEIYGQDFSKYTQGNIPHFKDEGTPYTWCQNSGFVQKSAIEPMEVLGALSKTRSGGDTQYSTGQGLLWALGTWTRSVDISTNNCFGYVGHRWGFVGRDSDDSANQYAAVVPCFCF